MAKELLSKPDGFITATISERFMDKELVIGSYQRKATHANLDDCVMHWTLNLRDGGIGNVKR